MIDKRVLIIDDEETIQHVVQFGIQMISGWEVIKANSGFEGIHTAQTERLDVILLDMMMPEMDGLTTFKKLKADPITEKIPVIFLTAKLSTSDKHDFKDLGVSGVIIKPFNSLELPKQIANILNW